MLINGAKYKKNPVTGKKVGVDFSSWGCSTPKEIQRAIQQELKSGVDIELIGDTIFIYLPLGKSDDTADSPVVACSLKKLIAAREQSK